MNGTKNKGNAFANTRVYGKLCCNQRADEDMKCFIVTLASADIIRVDANFPTFWGEWIQSVIKRCVGGTCDGMFINGRAIHMIVLFL